MIVKSKCVLYSINYGKSYFSKTSPSYKIRLNYLNDILSSKIVEKLLLMKVTQPKSTK